MSKVKKVILTVAFSGLTIIAYTTAVSACGWFSHQPKCPDHLLNK